MKIVVAPDKFAGTMSATEVAAAYAAGWRSVRPQDDVELVPLSDGGPGFLACLAGALGGETVPLTVTGPSGDPVPAAFLLHRTPMATTCYVEAALANGLHLVAPDRRDPLRATTAGVGELLAAGVRAGADRVVVGLGGSATNDGGAGMLAALGATARDSSGAGCTQALASGPGGLAPVETVDLSGVSATLAGAGIQAATDVDNPLLGPSGASYGFGRQKGAAGQVLARLESAMAHWRDLCEAAGAPPHLADAAGSGAAGGLGYGLLVAGAERVSGIDTVLSAVELAQRCADADLVVTGEGRFDWQSQHGKVVSGVVRAARSGAGPTVVVVAGQSDVPEAQWRAMGISDVRSLVAEAGSVPAAMARGPSLLRQIAADLARATRETARVLYEDPRPQGGDR